MSRPENGVKDEFALSELGRQQAVESAQRVRLTGETVIYASDFSRASETAALAQAVLDVPEVHGTEKLRERHFGAWELTSHDNYAKVWDDDQYDAGHVKNDVESVEAVLDRATSLVLELERKYQDKNILLVSHGDTLQILQAGFQKIDPRKHRSLPHLNTAEIRELVLAG